MIRYDLVCDAGHAFDAWFRDSGGFDEQARAGYLQCPRCGGGRVSKAVMAPSVARAAADAGPGPELAGGRPAEARAMLRELRRRVVEGSVDVGERFADEARRVHRGESPHRAVRGSASPDQVRGLLEEGVPVLPLPTEARGH